MSVRARDKKEAAKKYKLNICDNNRFNPHVYSPQYSRRSRLYYWAVDDVGNPVVCTVPNGELVSEWVCYLHLPVDTYQRMKRRSINRTWRYKNRRDCREYTEYTLHANTPWEADRHYSWA